MSKTFITGFFRARAAAEAAVDALIKRGYSRDDISVLMSDEQGTKSSRCRPSRTRPMAWGLAAQSVAPWAPFWRRLSEWEPHRDPRSRAGCRGTNCGGVGRRRCRRRDRRISGLLVGTGIPEHRAKVYDTDVRGGGILLGVEAKTDDDVEKLETLLEDIGAENVRTK